MAILVPGRRAAIREVASPVTLIVTRRKGGDGMAESENGWACHHRCADQEPPGEVLPAGDSKASRRGALDHDRDDVEPGDHRHHPEAVPQAG